MHKPSDVDDVDGEDDGPCTRDAIDYTITHDDGTNLKDLADADVVGPGDLNSVSGLVSKVWYRIPFDQ